MKLKYNGEVKELTDREIERILVNALNAPIYKRDDGLINELIMLYRNRVKNSMCDYRCGWVESSISGMIYCKTHNRHVVNITPRLLPRPPHRVKEVLRELLIAIDEYNNFQGVKSGNKLALAIYNGKQALNKTGSDTNRVV